MYGSYLNVPAKCPYCGRSSLELGSGVEFFWGRIHQLYRRLGQRVEWLTCEGKVVPPFTLLELPSGQILSGPRDWTSRRLARLIHRLLGPGDPGESVWNYGSPEFLDLFAFDVSTGFPDHRRTCGRCGRDADGVAAWIEGGRFASVKVFREGEVAATLGTDAHDADVVLRRPDETFWARVDWAKVDGFRVVTMAGEVRRELVIP